LKNILTTNRLAKNISFKENIVNACTVKQKKHFLCVSIKINKLAHKYGDIQFQ
jgi:hypothetical protein